MSNVARLQDFASTCVALFLMFWLFTSSLTAIVIPWYQLMGFSHWNITVISVLSVSFLLCLISYAAASLTSPGRVPKWFIELHSSKEIVESHPVNAEKPRWCGKCNAPKPPRAHHCSACGVCVLKMDHHCPWISNCVGFYNQKQFLQFLFYTLLAMLFQVIAIGDCIIPRQSGSFFDVASMPQLLILIINMSLFLVLSVLISIILVSNMLQACKNITVIEKEELSYAELRLKVKVIFPYTFLKRSRNLQVVFGTKWLLWVLPVPGGFHLGDQDGCTFPTRKGAAQNGYWPLFEHSKAGEHEEEMVPHEHSKEY